ncbi:MAG: 4-hydroxybutyrate--acetyl-CoA CoA transferase [Chloroflexi bacterium HGW-Chloroflexi-9]|nr:MAG: 4-hydroxybutyrate--acetyl-CoA CoA transferase [Chloroflexi bacterium HGW-Chloroflexi-9]
METGGQRSNYEQKRRSAHDAIASIPHGARIVVSMAAGEPTALLEALAERIRSGGLQSTRATSLIPMAGMARTILAPEIRGALRWESMFASAVDRPLIQAGEATFTPAYFHQIPRLIREFMDVDVALVSVSPPDHNGYMSLGVSVDIAPAAIESARYVVAQVNTHMPRVHGSGWVHLNDVDVVVEADTPLPELLSPAPREEDSIIGSTIADMIPDGACVQLGIGGMPNAVAANLAGHRHLGIHTEMFVESMVDLIVSGVADGSRKTFHPGRAVFTFAAGTRRMYDFLDDNLAVEAHPVSYVNFPPNIARNDGLVSVNSTLEVDLTGQCCSESLGTAQFSGTGGQMDYARGAFDSRGGRSILAFYSTARGGAVSRVVSRLTPGAVVTTPRTEVHWLVSEYGTACLKGASVSERARAIIGLAHPRFRDELTAAGRQLGYL